MRKAYLTAALLAALSLTQGICAASPTDDPMDSVYVEKTVQADNAKAKAEMPKPADLANVEPAYAKTARLTDRQAIPAVRSLYRYLAALPQKGYVLYGHQNDAHHKMFRIKSGTESDTKDVTGSLSGVVGIDALSLTGDELHPREAAKIEGTTLMDKTVNLSLKAAKEGAILTMSMHLPNFEVVSKKPKVNGKYDFLGYSANKLEGNVAHRILPGGDLNPVYTAYLDMVAEYALHLQAANVPVLFRPFHEHNGSWFWWGGNNVNDEDFDALWKFTVKYLRDTKGVHNFLYAYSPNGPFDDADRYFERYPGDAWVDMLGVDYYQDNGNDAYYDQLETTLALMRSEAEKRHKLIGLTECGVRDGGSLALTHNKDKKWFTRIMQICQKEKVPYYLTWANFEKEAHNFFEPYMVNDTRGHEMVDDFVRFYNEPASIFADGNADYRQMP